MTQHLLYTNTVFIHFWANEHNGRVSLAVSSADSAFSISGTLNNHLKKIEQFLLNDPLESTLMII